MIHVMVDLETISLANNAALLSIGAIVFDEEHTWQEFYVKIDSLSCVKLGLHKDSATLDWWEQQDSNARKEAFSGTEQLAIVLVQFTEWLDNLKTFQGEPVTIWGNGVAADNIWLKSAYAACGFAVPWSYKHDRCYRTMMAMLDYQDAWVQPDIAHHALSDAKAQAETLILAMERIPGVALA